MDLDVTCQRAEYWELFVNNQLPCGFKQIGAHAKNTQLDKRFL